jgi:hypothetical protein
MAITHSDELRHSSSARNTKSSLSVIPARTISYDSKYGQDKSAKLRKSEEKLSKKIQLV